MSTSSLILNGKTVSIPKGFFDVVVKASFGENVQANLSTEEFTFILDGYQEILRWIADGRNGGVGIFEGIPLVITNQNETNNVAVFRGIIDLQAGSNIQENLRQVSVKLRQDNSLNQLADLLEPLDYGYLKELGVITSGAYVNIDYVVNKTDSGIETITAFITIYLLSKQLVDTIKEIGTSIANVAGLTAAVPAGPLGAVIYAVAVAIIQILYAAALLVLIIDLGKDMLNILVQPKRTHKGITLRSLLQLPCEYLGYTFESSIEELDKVVYLPSNRNVDEFGFKNVLNKAGSITEGIPNIGDAGYSCTDMFQLMRDLFNARFAIVNSTVQFHSENSDFWISQSGWVKPNTQRDVSGKSFRYNTDEIKASILLSFNTDVIDDFTIKNYIGTSYQVLTDAQAVGKKENKTIKGLDRASFPFSLGSRKKELTPFEDTLIPLANLFDKLGDFFGKSPNLANKIKTKVGVLEVSNNNHSVPKLLYMNGGRIPSNHKDLFSAKTLYDKYHIEKSFVANNFKRQRKIIEREVIPFGLNDFVTLLNSSYFRDENGTIGKVLDIEWNMDKNYATIDYWTQEIYTTNLKETFIEPS